MDSEEFSDANDDQAIYDEEMASVYDEIDVKDSPLFPSLECDGHLMRKLLSTLLSASPIRFISEPNWRSRH